MRQSFKSISSNKDPKANLKANKIPAGGGIQVIPVLWRQYVQFDTITKSSTPDTNEEVQNNEKKISEVRLSDLTLEGVPSIRMLVSDVILDVLLYMTPKYRQQMVTSGNLNSNFVVVNELNRIYSLYLKRNPDFKGKVSIYGHSLGSLLSYDILSNQSGQRQIQIAESREVDLSDINLNINDEAQQGEENWQLDVDMLNFNVESFFGRFFILFLII